MIKYYNIILLIFWVVSDSTAQAKYDYNIVLGYDWTLEEEGIQANRLTFTENGLEVYDYDNGIQVDGYATTMSDREGNLLFYSNGCDIVGADGELLPGGDGINLPAGNYNNLCEGSFQAYTGDQIISLPDPGNENGYYILHMARNWINLDTDSVDIPPTHALYTYVHEINGELTVTRKNQLFASIDTFGGIDMRAIQHANGRDWFFFLNSYNSNNYILFAIDDTGIHQVGEQSIGPVMTPQTAGSDMYTPDGEHYLFYDHHLGLNVFDYDRSTGMLSNHQQHFIERPEGSEDWVLAFTGIAVSPSSQYVYVVYGGEVTQLDLWSQDIVASGVKVATWSGDSDPGSSTFYRAILGPDCRIYMCTGGASRKIHVIHKPDEKGLACDFREGDIRMPYPNGIRTMPNFPHFRIDEEDICDPTITSVFGMPVETVYRPRLNPNPAFDMVSISYPVKSYEIWSVTGGQLINYKGSETEQIDISILAAGLYFIYMEKADGSRWTDKLVVGR